MSSWDNFQPGSRPIAIIGAGVLGRRIAAVWLAAGYTVHIRDTSEAARNAASQYVQQNLSDYANLTKDSRTPGSLTTFGDVEPAVKDAFLVIEAIPENPDLKTDLMATLDGIVSPDCIIASNSSSYKSREICGKVDLSCRNRICNMHYLMPPQARLVELMTNGETDPAILEFLARIQKDAGMLPAIARKESTGFIFNRLWAAIKRECLTIMAEGVSDPGQIDTLWRSLFQFNPQGPCEMMDNIGLDTVAFIEQHYVDERQLDGSKTVRWLQKNYIDEGKLGVKGGKGGFYPPGHIVQSSQSEGHESLLVDPTTAPTIYALDVGTGGNVENIENVGHAGRIIAISYDGKQVRELIKELPMPDGIQISVKSDRMFWTNMGRAPSENNGSVMTAKLDGSDVKTIVPEGDVHTPKQLVVDEDDSKVYFCDREGLRVHRCNFDGSEHEILVQTGDWKTSSQDQTLWCVGITIDQKHGHLYWSQKGASKAGQGRIFRAGLNIPEGETATNRSDIELLLDHLPEPIDLEILPETQMLYWTDRGELPLGNSLNRAFVGGTRDGQKRSLLARHLSEAIGIRVDQINKHIYVAELGGRLYRFGMDGSDKKIIYSSEGAFTGIDLDFVGH